MNETELLFTQVLNCRRTDLYLNKKLSLDSAQAAFISSALKRRLTGEPLQYILGKTEFMGLEFKVTRDVFIPRPETEILAEATIRIGYPVIRLSGYPVKILDLGTGCGCIAISLAKFLPGTKITALDISDKTLELAKENAELHGVKIKFLKMDLTGNWQTGNRITDNFDIIVSNPPYIPSRQIDKLQPEVRREPRVALDAGRDGLDFYRRIAVQAPAYLKAGGFLILEMGFGQRDRIEDILQKSGNFKIKEVNRDYSGIERVIAAQKEV